MEPKKIRKRKLKNSKKNIKKNMDISLETAPSTGVPTQFRSSISQTKNKECPKCKKKVGLRTKTCPKCANKFVFKPKINNPKKCPNCFEENRPRSKECIKCKHVFVIKKKKQFEPIKNWKKLRRGQIIYIRGNSGPYYILETDGTGAKKGDKIPMGYKGKFIVDEIKEDGICAYENNAHCFIYMGEKKISKYGQHLRPHKLLKRCIT